MPNFSLGYATLHLLCTLAIWYLLKPANFILAQDIKLLRTFNLILQSQTHNYKEGYTTSDWNKLSFRQYWLPSDHVSSCFTRSLYFLQWLLHDLVHFLFISLMPVRRCFRPSSDTVPLPSQSQISIQIDPNRIGSYLIIKLIPHLQEILDSDWPNNVEVHCHSGTLTQTWQIQWASAFEIDLDFDKDDSNHKRLSAFW